jgi:uncharacterized protein (TIGR02145 family)
MKSLHFLAILGIVLILASRCSKDSTTSQIPYGTVSDYEGNAYKTVPIGTQTWMAENLRSIKLNDGMQIVLVTDNNSWSNLTAPAYCYYGNDSTSYKYKYGALYNWYTVDTKKLCPTGWHVPTVSDWTILKTYLGTDSLAGGKLKDASSNNWNLPNLYATNSTKFTAWPGGYRFYNGSYNNSGYSGNWWSSTAKSAAASWYFYLIYSDGKLGQNSYDNTYGFSVRCIKD